MAPTLELFNDTIFRINLIVIAVGLTVLAIIEVRDRCLRNERDDAEAQRLAVIAEAFVYNRILDGVQNSTGIEFSVPIETGRASWYGPVVSVEAETKRVRCDLCEEVNEYGRDAAVAHRDAHRLDSTRTLYVS